MDKSSFEYNAPQYREFTLPDNEDGEVDKYFDHATEDKVSTTLAPLDGVNDAPMMAVPNTRETYNTSEKKVVTLQSTQLGDNAESTQEEGGVINENKSKAAKDYFLIQTKINKVQEEMTSKLVKIQYSATLQSINENTGDYELKPVEVGHKGINVNRKRKHTEVKPFSFEERHRQLRAEKENKINAIYEEERKMREFQANPVPKFVASSSTKRNSRCTDPVELNLKTVERIQKRNIRSKCLEEKNFQFTARPANVLKKPPFIASKSDKLVTDPDNVILNTEVRATERMKFDEKMVEKEVQIEMINLQRKQREERLLLEHTQQLRKETVHKAQPMPQFKPVLPVFSRLPLTEPKSPNFATQNRLRK